MNENYTAILRKIDNEYVAVCLELDVTARGADLKEIEKHMHAAIEGHFQDLVEYPDTPTIEVTTEELSLFLKETPEIDPLPDVTVKKEKNYGLRFFECHEVTP